MIKISRLVAVPDFFSESENPESLDGYSIFVYNSMPRCHICKARNLTSFNK